MTQIHGENLPVRTVRIETLPHRYQKDVASAVKTLQRFGAERVILYGSLARGDERADSDLDICVEGIPAENFFSALGECLLHSEHSISVIDLQSSYGPPEEPDSARRFGDRRLRTGVSKRKLMNNRQTYHLVTLGCPKNEVDSDGMEMLLRQADFGVSADARQADVLIVNTCGFLEAAKEESIGVLQELADGKRRHQMLIAAGCLAQRNGEEVLARVPQVDGLLGTRRWMDVVELIKQVRGGTEQRRLERYSLLGEPDESYVQAVPRPPVAGGSAYLKISDGLQCAMRVLHDSQLQR